jgi:type I restriction-modification system DNA methylase subunit
MMDQVPFIESDSDTYRHELTTPLPTLDDAMAETLRRAVAAEKDAAMLGESGYDRIEADAYFTPPENVDCLSQFVDLPKGIWEPACGSGNITLRLKEFGHEVISSDLHTYGFEEQIGTFDFLAADAMPDGIRAIVTNPPYGDLVEKFIRHGLKLTKPKGGLVALFLRNEYDCGKNRMDLFGLPPFSKKIVVTKRPRWIEGSSGSPRHNYAWFVWDWRQTGPASIHYQHPDFATPRILKD